MRLFSFRDTVESFQSLFAGRVLLAALAGWVTLFSGEKVRGQNDQSRREYTTPGLVVATPGRTGACDVLAFTADGKYLLATGDDKVVRNWKVSARGLEPSNLPTLRWSIFREQRGNIYAMAFSPDDKQRYVAVAGTSIYSGDFGAAIIDRQTGQVKYGLKPNHYDKTQVGSVWSLAFSPAGAQLALGTDGGAVWLWDFRRARAGGPRLLGRHIRRNGDGAQAPFNYVRLLTFLDEERLISVAEDGEVRRWDFPAEGGEMSSTTLFRFKGPVVARVAVSADRKWLAAADEPRRVEVLSLPKGEPALDIELPAGHFLQCLALDGRGSRLAVGIRMVDQDAAFFRETEGRVLVYDLRKDARRPMPGPLSTFHPEALSFHPQDDNILAIAGGNDHEVALWDLGKRAKRSEVVGPGTCLWGLALSPDAKGRYLAFQTQRDPETPGPNSRGRGEWKFFDLQMRRWATGKPFAPQPASQSAGGWKVLTSLPDQRLADVWYVQGPGTNGPVKLPLDRSNAFPRCYTFLPDVEGKPVRLAVGHYWGVSIFELAGPKPRRIRLLTGHEGEVMALAVSADGKKLVSCGRDQTVAGWSLEDWPNHPSLGGEVFLRQGKLMVGKVATGSPTWEAGMSTGDEVMLLVVDKKIIFNRANKFGPSVGKAEDALLALKQPTPGIELYFAWQRSGKDKRLVEQLTKLIDRPLWRFFPTRDREWVLWRWRDYYYDTSTNGDFNIGWVRTHAIDKTPEFYRAEQFREKFLQPKKVAATLALWEGNQEQLSFALIEPPRVSLRVKQAVVNDADLEVTLTALPRGPLDNQKPANVTLWVNDFQFRRWDKNSLRLNEEGAFEQTVTVPRQKLRQGTNLVTLQCYNRGDLRAESPPVAVTCKQSARPRDLFGLFVGVGDYRKSQPRQQDLHSADDVVVLREAWKAQKGKLYQQVHLDVLRDAQVTAESVLSRLESLADKVQPDDLLVFHLGGHGVGLEDLKGSKKLPPGELQGLDGFLFCCGNFNIRRLHDSTIGFDQIYERLVKLPCHKLVLLDTCRSGAASKTLAAALDSPVRALTRDGIGPIILAACDAQESAHEEETVDLGRAYGLFTVALRRTLEEMDQFDRADKDGKGQLQAVQLAESVRGQVRDLIRQFRAEGVPGVEDQNPVSFLPRLERDLPLVARR
jgi:WD40 repeat protein